MRPLKIFYLHAITSTVGLVLNIWYTLEEKPKFVIFSEQKYKESKFGNLATLAIQGLETELMPRNDAHLLYTAWKFT